ncbi:MAG: tRNA (N6-isopentenyl adenosine(37)-C2)-methylthiotransferase MiaB [Pseudomonadota bacterium]
MTSSHPRRQLFIKSWGCQMNFYDSERIAELLAPHGYGLCDKEEGADLVVLNTCHIREKAAEKLYSYVGQLRSSQNPPKRLAVGGCVAQAEGSEMIARAPEIDLVFGPGTYHRLPEMLARIERDQLRNLVETDFPEEDKFDHLDTNRIASRVGSFVTIQEGCDKFCTFCVVPYTRGQEVSRRPEQILDEVKSLIDTGTRMITLLGQNVNGWQGIDAYGRSWDFADLLAAIAALDGLVHLLYTTSHPMNVTDRLIAAHGELDKLMPWLHLPVQSGSDRILKAMNRRHNSDDYRMIVEKLRKARPDLALSSDFIVGFPGESDQDFALTLKLVHELTYASAYSFAYSARPGTPACAMEHHIEHKVKHERLQALQQILNAQQDAFNQRTIGKSVPVLIEGQGQKPGQWRGRSPWMQPVHFNADDLKPGDLVLAQITGRKSHSLFAKAKDKT